MKRTLALALLLSACAGSERMRWTINSSNPEGPIAIYGPSRDTEGDAGLNCDRRRDRLVVFLVTEAPLTNGTTVKVAANRSEIMIRERFEADGMGIAFFDLPRSSAVAREIAGTARQVRIGLPKGELRLPLAEGARGLARECLTRR